MKYTYKQLHGDDLGLMQDLLKLFGQVFDEPKTYQEAVPDNAYLADLLDKPHFIALVALNGQQVIGGLVAYVLEKFEQNRREIYLYDLAVGVAYRRQGVATGLITELKNIAQAKKAYMIFVQADHGDEGAIKLYESLGVKENVYHFDINPATK